MAQKLAKKENAQARSRTGGSKMATLNFTAKPLALLLKFSAWTVHQNTLNLVRALHIKHQREHLDLEELQLHHQLTTIVTYLTHSMMFKKILLLKLVSPLLKAVSTLMLHHQLRRSKDPYQVI